MLFLRTKGNLLYSKTGRTYLVKLWVIIDTNEEKKIQHVLKQFKGIWI